MFKFFRKNSERDAAALALYSTAVEQARLPVFYESYGVADTPDGRFDMIMVHVFLILRRLKDGDKLHQDLAQAVFDMMFADMDQNLREMGAGDIGVSHRIKDMAKAFYGRIAVYEAGLDDAEKGSLEAALRRNLYRKNDPHDAQVSAMSTHIRAQALALSDQALEEFVSGRMKFDAPSPEVGMSND